MHKFGLVFFRKDGRGGFEHTFPELASIEKMDRSSRPTLFSQHPEIRAGSRLAAINGHPTDRLHEGGVVTLEALRLFRMSTVRLEFALGTQVHTSLVEPWILAGLDAISIVRRQGSCEPAAQRERANAEGRSALLRQKDAELARKDEELAKLRAALKKATTPPEGLPPV